MTKAGPGRKPQSPSIAGVIPSAFPGEKEVSRADVVFDAFLSQDPESRQ